VQFLAAKCYRFRGRFWDLPIPISAAIARGIFTSTGANMPRVPEGEVRNFAEAVLDASGAMPEDTHSISDGLIYATKRGVTTHGVFRLPQYSECLRGGKINVRPHVGVISRRGCTGLVDAGGGYGFRPTSLAVELGVEMAREHGVAIIGVRNSHHFGAAGAYTSEAAVAGMIGLVTTTTRARMAPTGAMGPVVGNNPISISVPRRAPHKPLVLDMALSQVALGRVRVAAAGGHDVPEGWGYDKQGRPTTDPNAIIDGLLAPVGEHKGYGLSVMVEVLAGVLTNSPFGLGSNNHDHRNGGVGHFVLVIAPDFMRDLDEFYEGVETLMEQIRASPAVEGQKVYLPGEIEDAKAAEADRDGLPISDELAGQLARLAGTLKLDVPAWLG
jgi:LDH2 family malate/lactate/ureidoglycolate dehydrogenase